MATDSNDLLNRLRKLLAEAAGTTDFREPWQELFGRQDSVPPRAIRAAEAVRGFSGSWAASYGFSPSMNLTNAASGNTPTPKAGVVSQLGRIGYPEINFVPYNWNTNAFGINSPALVGHPVSFEFVGPTVKNSTVSFGVDFNLNAVLVSDDVTDTFGITDNSLQTTPHWVMINDPGAGLDAVHEGYYPPTALNACGETKKHHGTARYELFRVQRIEEKKLILHGGKVLSDYFENADAANNANLGAVSLIKPKVARLAPISRDNRTWAVLPPARAAQGEYKTSLDAWTGLDEDWLQGVALPIPKPITLQDFDGNKKSQQFDGNWNPYYGNENNLFTASLSNGLGMALGVPDTGRFRVFADNHFLALVNKRLSRKQKTILQVHDIQPNRNRARPDWLGAHNHNRIEQFLGYHEIVDVGDNYLECRLQQTVDPTTGEPAPFFDAWTIYEEDNQDEDYFTFECSLHAAIDSLFSDVQEQPQTNYDDIEAARLTGLIDPKEVGRSLKRHGVNEVPIGAHSLRADRAIPNTQINQDPGSMLDLGFRMVLYTAKPEESVAPLAVAASNTPTSPQAKQNDFGDYVYEIDWNNPLTSNELILDPSITDETQYVDVDYAAGTVTFSHQPKAGGDIAISHGGEPIIFAAFVPYSMEGGQRGSAVRVTGGDLLSANLGYPNPIQHDVFSQRALMRTVNQPQNVGHGGNLQLRFEKGEDGEYPAIPSSGYVHYLEKEHETPYTDTHNCLTNDVFSYGAIEHTVDGDGNKIVILHDVHFDDSYGVTYLFDPNTTVTFNHRVDIKYAYDTSRGSSARTDVIRFNYADLTYNKDGSVSVMPTAVAGPAQELRSYFPLGERLDKTTEVSRFHFDELTQRWTTDDPPWMDSGHEDPPNQSHEIGIEVSRGRLYTNWEFSPKSGARFRRVAGLITNVDYAVTNKSQPVPSGFKVRAEGAMLLNCFPNLQDLTKAYSLHAVVEGGAISSRTYPGVKGGDVEIQHPDRRRRFVFAVKDYPSSVQSSQTSPANPRNWVSVIVDAGVSTTLAALAVKINDVFAQQGISNAAYIDPRTESLKVEGRQVQAIPSFPFFASNKVGLTLSQGTYEFTINLQSAMGSFGRSEAGWVHFNVSMTVGPAGETFASAADFAAALNERLLYSSTTIEKLEAAGFYQGLFASENPELLAAGIREHQLVFVAENDPRAPSTLGANQVALLCSGQGVAAKMPLEATQDASDLDWGQVIAPSVLVEIDGHNQGLGNTKKNLLEYLGGDFEDGARAALLFGIDSRMQSNIAGKTYPTGANPDGFVAGSWDNPILGAYANHDELGFPKSGTTPIGRFIGSFPIESARHNGNEVEFNLRFPTGQSSNWFNDQTAVGDLDKYLVKSNPLTRLGLSAYDNTPVKRSRNGWLGRWAWPHNAPEILSNEALQSVGGISDIYLTFADSAWNEHEFSSLLGGVDNSRTSFLVEVSPEQVEEWTRPQSVWDDISYGDVFTAYNDEYKHPVLSGRVIQKVPKTELDENGDAVDTAPQLFVLAQEMIDVTPKSFRVSPESDVFACSVVPSPIWGRHAAVAHTMSIKAAHGDKELSSSHGFGSAHPSPDALSSVLIGAGRVSMLSSLGSIEPTGFALHNLIEDPQKFKVYNENDPATFGQTSVYVESGAWSMPARGDQPPYWSSKGNRTGTHNTPQPRTSSVRGGVGGLRVSGDAHLWLNDIQALRSKEDSAYVLRGHVNQSVSGRKDTFAGHLPDAMTTLVPARGMYVTEATVVIGLKKSDLAAVEGFINTHSAYGTISSASAMGVDFPGFAASPNPYDVGEKYLALGQAGTASDYPLPMPSLAGSYIEVGQTTFKVIATPVIQIGGSSDSILYNWTKDGSAGTPLFADHPPINGIKEDTVVPSRGRNRESQFVAFMAIRVETFVGPTDVLETPTPQAWAFYRDSDRYHLIYTAHVVDPGGSPTGAPSSLRGLTLDPKTIAGKSWLKAEILFDNDFEGASPSSLPSTAPVHQSTNFQTLGETEATQGMHGTCELLGVHDQIGRYGKHSSRAFFTMPASKFDPDTFVSMFARMVVLSDSSGLVDGDSNLNDLLGYPRRLGPGVMMDGGLGLVQATAFRARPRPKQTESLGQMTVWGRGAYPFFNDRDAAYHVGVELPSTFNTSEFHGEVSIANPQGRLVFESPWATEGLAANMFTAQFASENYVGPHHYGWKGINAGDNIIPVLESGQESLYRTGGLGMSDTLFPYVSSGIVYKTPGTTVYERAFSSIDATGSNPHRKSQSGSHNRGGIAGMGVPFKGEVLLLPQGPTSQGTGKADYTYGEGETPLDIPLYEFLNGATESQMVKDGTGNDVLVPKTILASSPFGINLSGVIGGNANMSYARLNRGPAKHKGEMGTVSQAYRHSNSRESTADYDTLAEDGRSPSFQVRLLDGMVLEDTTNGTFYTVGSIGRDVYRPNATTAMGFLGDDVRSPVNGSLVASGADQYRVVDPTGTNYDVRALPEALYDFTDAFKADTDPFVDTSNGFGDRTDSGAVRRPLFGHNMRITPNVEFVPVLGPRGVRGGLLPPWINLSGSGSKFRLTMLQMGMDADAIFYDLNHDFKADDTGKMLYICGTHTYEHTGWWVVVAVIDERFISESNIFSGRKAYAHGDGESECELTNFAVLRKYNWKDRQVNHVTDGSNRMTVGNSQRSYDATGMIPLRYRAPYVTLVADKKTNLSDGKGFLGTAYNGDGDMTCGDFRICFIAADGTKSNVVVDSTTMEGLTTLTDVGDFLNGNVKTNGQEFLSDLNGKPVADVTPFVFWSVIENVLFGRYLLNEISMSERGLVLGGQAGFTVYWETRTDLDDKVGFVPIVGHSLNADRTEGDRNNAFPVQTALSTMNDTFTPYKETAARGLRWVFSHPLTEENVGSYVHLTKPHKYHFGRGLVSQESLNLTAAEIQVQDSTWTTGYYAEQDQSAYKGIHLTTDIWRINRCPNTGKIVLGGDCEVYFTEAHKVWRPSGADLGYGQAVMYSPLGVHGNWQDTDTGGLPVEQLNWPTLYDLQPIAREKIVSISPSSAKSSFMFTRGRGDQRDIPIGPQGVGPMVVAGNAPPNVPEASFVMEPFQLMSRSEVLKTAMALPSELQFDTRVEANNADVNLVSLMTMIEKLEAQRAEAEASVTNLEAQIADNESESASSTVIVNDAMVVVNELSLLMQEELNDIENIDADGNVRVKQAMFDDWEKIIEQTESFLAEVLQLVFGLQGKETEAANAVELASIEVLELTEAKTALAEKIGEKQSEKAALEVELADLETNKDAASLQSLSAIVLLTAKENEIRLIDENYDFEADLDSDDANLQALIYERREAIESYTNIANDISQLSEQILLKQQDIETLVSKLTALHSEVDAVDEELTVKTDYENQAISLLQEVQWKLALDVAQIDNILAVVGDGFSTLDENMFLSLLGQADMLGFSYASLEKAVEVALSNMNAAHASELGAFEAQPEVQTLLVHQEVVAAFRQAIEILVAESVMQNRANANRYEALVELNKDERLRVKNKIANYDQMLADWQANLKILMAQGISDPVIASKSEYVWSPAGEWWQLYQPAWDQYGPDASAAPPTLRVDLTETFTQAIGPGSGLNSPHPGRFPRGVRLNRLWVNFGSWGTPPNTKGGRRMMTLPGYVQGMEEGETVVNDVLDELYISFNLILEIPGSQAREIQTGRIHPKGSGTAGFPFGDRAPTSATNHRSNEDANDEFAKDTFPGGTIVVPLYVNREAGDMMPNVMERFVTVGPKPRWNSNLSLNTDDPEFNDWSGGHYEHGFGASGDVNDTSLYSSDNLPLTYQRLHWSGIKSKDFHTKMFVNSFNPVVWGGMDFAPPSEGGVFEKPKYARVQASVFPRQSVMGGGYRSVFTSGLEPDGEVFKQFEPHSLSAATMTGVTVAHSAQHLAPPMVQAGSYASSNTEGGYSCPHAFTVALTPVGDSFIPSRSYRPGGLTPTNDADHWLGVYGRGLETKKAAVSDQSESTRAFKVGNWLDRIKTKYGIFAPSGSMLPPGSRVYLEVAVGPGPSAKEQDPEAYCAAGTWVGGIKLSFDVETADGTAWTTDVNTLGDEEG